jgi:hypothetical protein
VIDQSEELKSQIKRFLFEFKQLMYQGPETYYVKNHLKNIQTLADLGITVRERDNIIRSLELCDYSSGPVIDENHPESCYWVFGKDISSVEIYIKLKIYTNKFGDDKAICISFHPSEYPMKYPFRN